jgi:cobalt-zinc-cadmium efflux system membrane fusion protein
MRYLIVLMIATLFLFSACKSDKEVVEQEQIATSEAQEISLTDSQMNSMSLQFGDVVTSKMSSEINVQGRIDLPPQNLISVNFPLGGYLKSTKLIPGMHVSKGEIIAIMEDQGIVQLQQDYLQSVTRLELAKAEFERQKTLAQNNAGTTKAYQQAESEYGLQSINVKSFGEKLKLIGIDPAKLSTMTLSGQVPIRSTINGFVSKVNVNTGKYVQATETIFELIDPDDIHAALTIFEKDLPFIKKGNNVSIKFIDDPKQTYAAEVILVSQDIDQDRTAIAHCHFRNKPKTLLPGMFIEASISLDPRNMNVLPEDAVVLFGNQHYVFYRKSKSILTMKGVEVGLSKDNKIEITKGLEEIPKGSLVLNHAHKLMGILKNSGEE